MDQKKLLKSNDKESIKKAMLKQEEIFREQVHELHRLYGKQKLLMNTMGNRGVTQQATTQKRERVDDLDSLEAIEESEIQLTLGPSVYKINRNNGSSSGQSLSSSNSTGSSQIQNKGIVAPSRKDSTWEFSRRSSQNSIEMNQERMKQHPPWLFQALSLKLS